MLVDRLVYRVLVDPPFFGLAARVLDFSTPRRFSTLRETFFQNLSVVFRKLVT